MAGQAVRRMRRARIVGMAATLVVAAPLLAPTGAHAEKASVGVGAIHGTTEFDAPGLATGDCTEEGVGFKIDGFAPSVVYNTVITGFVGAFRLTGRGFSECEGSTEVTRHGTLGDPLRGDTLRATGTGPTGSQLECPNLSGQFDRVSTVVVVSVGGDCIVNSYGLSTITFIAVIQFTPVETVETPQDGRRVMKAYFDGEFTMTPRVD